LGCYKEKGYIWMGSGKISIVSNTINLGVLISRKD